jgi:FAD:protein FMN transferase
VKKTASFAALALLSMALLLWAAESREIRTRQVFVTDVLVVLEARGTSSATDKAFGRALDEIRRIDRRLGYQGSLIDELNRGLAIRDSEVYSLVRISRDVRRASFGAFSVTLKPVLDAWGFAGSRHPRVPTPGEIDSWRAAPGDDAVTLRPDGMTVEIPQGTGIDIGGTIEGYVADRAWAAMEAAGCRTGLVNVGGEVMAFGERTWKIGIKNPRGEGVFAVIPLRNRAIATSGDYERFFVDKGGTRYCHILDPATGWPARGTMSASVVADTCTQANAWAVALFVAGAEKLGPVLEKQGFDWITVDARGNVHASRAMAPYCPPRI